MLDPTLKSQWVNALRSGDYEQGKGELITRSGVHCCLGVLCEILPDVKMVADPDFSTGEWYGYEFPGECGFNATNLPDEFAANLGFSVGEYDSNERATLMGMNDNNPQKSFAEIADWIEENL